MTTNATRIRCLLCGLDETVPRVDVDVVEGIVAEHDDRCPGASS